MHISKSSVCWDLSLSRSRPTLTIPQLAAACSKPLMWKRSRGNTRVEPPTPPDSLISLAVNSQAESPCLRCMCCFQPRILSFFTHLTPTVLLDPTLVSPLHGALPEVSMVNIQPYQTFWFFTTLSPCLAYHLLECQSLTQSMDLFPFHLASSTIVRDMV